MASRSISVTMESSYRSSLSKGLRQDKQKIDAFQDYLNKRGFTIFAVTRSALWERLDLLALLKSYGTASGHFKVIGALNDAWLPGFAPAKT